MLFFALTRTQVGRDGLRYQIERQFASTYEGRLEIGKLTGNLAQDLFASQVRLYDPEGRVVIEIDSVVAHPRWTSLFQQRLSVRSLKLIRPRSALHYGADSTWNVAGVFRKRQAGPPGGVSAWSYDSADLTIVDGTVEASHDKAVPALVEQGWLFDFDDTTLEDVQAQATIEWSRTTKLIDVLDFSASLPDANWTIDQMQGQFLREDGSLLLNEFMLEGGDTDLHMDLALYNLSNPDSLRLDADVQQGRLDNDAVRRLIPRYPLADLLTFSGRVMGPLSNLEAENLTLAHGGSRLETSGTFSIGRDSLTFDAAFLNSRVATRDLRSLLPDATLPDLDHLGLVAFDADAEGSLLPGQEGTPLLVRANADVNLRARSGSVEGTVSLAWRDKATARYTLDLRADSLDVGLLLRDDRLASNLNGRINLEGRGLILDSLDATLQAHLNPSTLAGRRLDSLHVKGWMASQQLQVQGSARQSNGRLIADGTLDLRQPTPAYQLDLITRQLDAGPLLGVDSLTTALNAEWNLTGSGTSLADAVGTLRMQFDDSQVRFKTSERRIPAHLTTLTLAAPAPQQPRLQIDGEVLTLSLYGETPPDAVRALADLWYHATEDAIQHQQQKTYRRNQNEQAAPLATFATPALAQSTRQATAREALHAAALSALALDLDVQVKDPDLLAAFLPMLPALPPDLTSRLHLETDADRLRFTASVAGDSLRLAPVQAEGLAAEVEASMNLSAPLEQTLTARIDVQADSFQVAGQAFSASEVALHFANRQGHLTLQTQQPDAPTPARLAATLEVLPDRNRLTLQEVSLNTGTTAWHIPKPAPVDLYAGVVVVPDLLLASQPAEGQLTQRVRLYGALSRAPQDTFFVEVADIGLRDLASLRVRNRAVGGQLNGRVALTNTDRPELTGRLVVDALALDNDILGRLEATSRYVPGSPDVALDVRLAPIEPDSTFNNRFVRNNQLHLAGSFRLPQVATGEAARDPGAIDLTLDVARADVFFFEYLFSDLITHASGALTGAGAIRGTFDYPLFEADLQLSDGRFNIPKFNLAYEIDGNVRVDEEAIRLEGVSLRDKTGGSTTVHGALHFNEYRYFSFDLAAQLREMQIIDVPTSRELPFYGAIWATGNATLTGPLYNAKLEASDVVTTAQSEIFIPITEDEAEIDPGFIVFTDSTGQVPDLEQLTRRKHILASRPEGERAFVDGMEMDLNIFAPQGSTVHLVIDPLLGDVINAVGSGRIQLLRQEGDFQTFGSFTADSGDYLFTAGEVFVRRFLIESGTITWDGDPLNARLNIQAAYRTRASRTGLPTDIADRLQSLIPLVVNLNITGRVAAPQVGLNLAVDRSTREPISDTQFLETYLNQPDRAAQMATSVLLTNSFILTTEGSGENGALAGSAFNSVSQLVSSQLNRYLSQVVPNADFSFGVQGDETAEDLDLTAGLAIRLLDERLIIRGQGVYRGIRQTADEVDPIANQGLQGEFAVEVKLSPSVSVEVFYRREGDVFSESILTNTTGAGLSYNTQFTSWRTLYQRLFGTSDAPKTATASESASDNAGRN